MPKPTCAIDWCDKPRYTRATIYCEGHLARWRKGADMNKPFMQRQTGPCSVDGCPDDAKKKGMCEKHYIRTSKWGDPHYVGKKAPDASPMPQCGIDGCTNEAVRRRNPICSMHLSRHYRFGDAEVQGITPRRANRKRTRTFIRIPDGVSTMVILDEDTGQQWHVLYDDADHDMVAAYNWYVPEDPGYPTATPKGQKREVRLHRVLLGLESGDQRQVDHRNGNKLDARRSNLRIVDATTNMENQAIINKRGTSRFRNVHWNSRRRKWLVEFKSKGKIIFPPGGVFDDEIEAARFAWQWRADHGLEPGYWPLDEDARPVADPTTEHM